ncbi:hypothetical protein CAPTEDRAFT_218411 [Capitella teleta]|uniref:G-protein coupled receptors family 1 profile domain-containing protein n=1 Tax=Capitella teleta TaxID=283909 RepID=R7VJ92_CAPTE|nr:hypothetical protein CAPTEDRAFT_218411 [Capitella teleta]|eukprot:ELU18694.1 hypothetical protein CAPTEDRAFT_218411 [Capitella teleta]
MLFIISLVAFSSIVVAENVTDFTYNPTEANRGSEYESVYSNNLITTISFYCYNCIGGLSILCNGINIRVLQKQKLSSPYVFMRALAISDFLTGICIIMNTLLSNLDLLSAHRWMAQASSYVHLPTYYIRVSFSHYSTCLLNALSLDRLIAVKYPLHHQVWCTIRRARTVSVSLALFCAVFNIHTLLRFKMAWILHEYSLVPIVTGTDFGHIAMVSTVVLYLKFILQEALPLTLMIIGNTWTIYEIFKGMKFRQALASITGKQEFQCLGSTLGVIAVFIVTNSPSAVYNIRKALNPEIGTTVTLYLFELLRWTGGFTNLFIYVVVDKRFRVVVVRLLSCPAMECNKTQSSSNSDRAETTIAGTNV